MNSKQLALVGLVLILGACSDNEGGAESEAAQKAGASSAAVAAPSPIDESGPVKLDARVQLPEGIAASSIVVGACMTPVDYINGAPATPGPYPSGKDVSVVGWNIIDSETDPAPALIYGVFKPYDQAQSGALLVGERLPRADVASDNALYAMAGYELKGVFPAAAGRYRLYIWTGSNNNVVECDSKLVINVQ